MKEYLWNIVRADIHRGMATPDSQYFVRNAKRETISAPLSRRQAFDIAAAHNKVIQDIYNGDQEQ